MLEPLPLHLLFADVLPPEVRATVVDEMLSRSGELSPLAAAAARRLDDVKVPGFRDQRKAPRRARGPALAQAMLVDSHVAAAVMAVWFERSPELMALAQDFLDGEEVDHGIPSLYLPMCFPRFPPERLLDLSARLAGEDPSVGAPAAMAMITALTWWPLDLGPGDDDVLEEDDDDDADPGWADPWGELLDALETTAARDADWTRAQEFADRVLDLARRRLAELEEAREQQRQEVERAERRERIRGRLERYESLLTYLLLPGSSDIAARAAALPAGGCEEQVGALEADLDEIQRLREADAPTFEEDDANRSRIRVLKSSLAARVDALPVQSGPAPPAVEDRYGPRASSRPAAPRAPIGAEALPAGSGRVESSSAASVPNDDAGVDTPPEGDGIETPVPDVEDELEPAVAADDERQDATDAEEASGPGGDLAKLVAADAPPDVLATLLAQRQRQWLCAGHNLRAYLAADYAEARGLPPDGFVPSWLCSLAVLAGDERASRIAVDLGSDIPFALGLRHAEERDQRFFVAWLTAGLLGPDGARFLPLALNAPSEADLRFTQQSPFEQFCVHRILGVTRHTQLPPSVGGGQSPESLATAIRRELAEAASIVDRSANYQNTFVKRCWLQMVGHGGPVMELLQQARSGEYPELPTADQLAGQVPGWDQVQARYRANVLNRLHTFLAHLKRAGSLAREAAHRDRGAGHVLRADEVTAALDQGRELVVRLRSEGDCAASGYATAVARLSVLGARR